MGSLSPLRTDMGKWADAKYLSAVGDLLMLVVLLWLLLETEQATSKQPNNQTPELRSCEL